MFKIGYRTIKTAVGTAVAIIIAQMLHLESFPSAGIITILCIQVTKKKSLRASGARFAACMLAIALSSLMFEFIAFHPIVIGLFLLIFIPITVALKINEGIVTSSVILLHLYAAGNITFKLILNETLLITVGIAVALLMNLYMPSAERVLIDYQKRIEENFRLMLMGIVHYLRDNDHSWDGREIMETSNLLKSARRIAFRDIENRLLSDDDLYYSYFEMREDQFQIIERILPLVTNIPQVVKQSGMLAEFIEELANNVHFHNTAIIYLRKLEKMRQVFQEMPLPETRTEFESRAALVQLMNEMEEYLLLKHAFKGYNPPNEKKRVRSN
ncbi:aromatic acid exporter family protein [Bacillus massiliglaciei]|uniref:aromatic acid exporter family protein n=1 Tax=Bacillus massiliglaciei TaxID=1816693 RepID=UPI000A8E4AE6|nr:aromatic acid exporter family protein [Bacillus massiliglaciei]